MKYKTSDLDGALLDAAVGKAMGFDVTMLKTSKSLLGGRRAVVNGVLFHPSRDWRRTGPLLDREGISLVKDADQWIAEVVGFPTQTGPTPLVAACRAFVASKLGPEVEL